MGIGVVVRYWVCENNIGETNEKRRNIAARRESFMTGLLLPVREGREIFVRVRCPPEQPEWRAPCAVIYRQNLLISAFFRKKPT